MSSHKPQEFELWRALLGAFQKTGNQAGPPTSVSCIFASEAGLIALRTISSSVTREKGIWRRRATAKSSRQCFPGTLHIQS